MLQIGWKHTENQQEALNRYGDCMTKTIIAEQLFRSEMGRPRPGWYQAPEDDDE